MGPWVAGASVDSGAEEVEKVCEESSVGSVSTGLPVVPDASVVDETSGSVTSGSLVVAEASLVISVH